VALSSGARLGTYEVTALVGMGGMGEVYRARDTKLGRDVALKILPAEFVNDADRVARFQREAQVLASLNHPNIAAIYGLDETDGAAALVLEFVEGPTLADRIAQGPLPIDDALAIARQIAEAISAAHEQGVVHRDLKPANIKLRPDGTVKVLDFGLAKALDPAIGPTGPSPGDSPTMTSPAMRTGVGIILGTAAYMSPEQARGRQADKRSDIWAFGCVLYEMLSGRRAFDGEEVSETLASVLAREPNWTALPGALPLPLRDLLKRSLAKDRQQRVKDISVVQFLLDEAARSNQEEGPAATAAAPARHVAALLLAAALGAAITYAGVSMITRTPSARVARLSINTTGSNSLSGTPNNARGFAISPDGAHLTFVGGRDARLFVRSLDRLEATPLSSTVGVRSPFFSPDSQWIGYFDRAAIRKVSVAGGAASLIGPEPPTGAASGTWGEDGTIVVASNPGAGSGLWKIPANGGQPMPLTRPDATRGELAHAWPRFLPGGQAVLFTVLRGSLVVDENSRIAVLDLRSGERKDLVSGGSCAYYMPSGYLVYGRASALEAVGFDTGRQEVVGAPAPLIADVSMRNNGACDFDLSTDGTLVYLNASSRSPRRTLTWVDRNGREQRINAPPAGYTTLRLSPDETRVAMDINDGQKRDIWILDLTREVIQRLTNDLSQNVVPIWTPDGRSVVYSAGPAGKGNLYRQPADGSGSPERLTQSPNGEYPSAVLPDNRVLFREEIGSDRDLMVVPLEGERQPAPIVQTRFAEMNGEVSRDGRWLAYQANDSGQFEIYVRPFPNVGEARSLVSTGGGIKPAWSHDGRELFYFSADGALMAVPVNARSTWYAGKPEKVFDRGYVGEGEGGARSFDVSADGKRFLMIREDPSLDSGIEIGSLVIVLNWATELRSKVQVARP